MQYELAVTKPIASHKTKKKKYIRVFLPLGWPSATIQEYKISSKFQVCGALSGADGGIVSWAEKREENHPCVPARLHWSHSTSAASGE